MKKLMTLVLAVTALLTLFTACDNSPVAVYTITYDANGSTSGTAPGASSAVKGKSVLLRNEGTLKKEGYGFTGWTTAADGSGDRYTAGEEITPSSDMTLYASWSLSYNSVVFNPKNGEDLCIENVRLGDKVPVPQTPVKDGCEFLGWTLDGKDYDFNTVIDKSIVLVAKWKQVSCTVTFDTNGGSAVASQPVSYGKTITEPTTAKDGAVFQGWLLNGKAWDFSSPVTENMTLTASWNNDIYTVTFYTGTDDKIAQQNVAYGNKATEPTQELTRSGYGFGGWTLDGEVYDFSKTVTRNMVLVAKWNIFCTVVFLDSDGETAISDLQEVEYMKTATKPEAPVKKGYTFSHWIAPDNSTYNFARPVYTSMELTASWTPNEYTVTYNVNGGSTYGDDAVPSSTKYTYGDSVTLKGISTSKVYKTGCVFEGWTTSADGSGTVYKPGDTIVGDSDNMTLYAKWTDKNYSIGDIGPSGGIIIYVSQNSGNSFKYIEAAPEVLGTGGCYGYYRPDGENNTALRSDADDPGDGKTNTNKLVSTLGGEACTEENARTQDVGGGTTKIYNITGDYAALVCRKYSFEKDSVTYDDWSLPCLCEMKSFYEAVYKAKKTGVPTGKYITSTEGYDEDGSTKCHCVVFHTETVGSKGICREELGAKSDVCRIWPVRYI